MEHRLYTIKELLNNASFKRWAEGDADSAEAAPWDEWVRASEQNRETARKAREVMTGFSFADPDYPAIDREWEAVRNKINSGSASLFRHPYVRNNDTFGVFLKVAAVFVVMLLGGLSLFVYQKPVPEEKAVSNHTVDTEYGEKKIITLTDGSKIILAAGSSLSYAENWLSKPTKQVHLKGEAFFSIVPQKTAGHPKFAVYTKDGVAEVWGTRFTVAAYEESTQVVLAEGEVRVRVGPRENGYRKQVTMHPGEMIRFKKSSPKILLRNVNPRIYTSWTSNKLFFENTPLAVLVNRIERTYGVRVRVEEPELLEMKLSGAVDFRSFDSLIGAVSEVLDIHIARSNNNVIIKRSK